MQLNLKTIVSVFTHSLSVAIEFEPKAKPVEPQPCFNWIGGKLLPMFPYHGDGTAIEPDGERFLSASQAARRTGASRDALVNRFNALYSPILERCLMEPEPVLLFETSN